MLLGMLAISENENSTVNPFLLNTVIEGMEPTKFIVQTYKLINRLYIQTNKFKQTDKDMQ